MLQKLPGKQLNQTKLIWKSLETNCKKSKQYIQYEIKVHERKNAGFKKERKKRLFLSIQESHILLLILQKENGILFQNTVLLRCAKKKKRQLPVSKCQNELSQLTV